MSLLKEIVMGSYNGLKPASWVSACYYSVTTTLFAVFTVCCFYFIQGTHYYFQPLECLSSMKISGNLARLCWDAGFLQTDKNDNLDHYKDVPFGLVFLTFMFYFPHFVCKFCRQTEPLDTMEKQIMNINSNNEREENLNLLVSEILEKKNKWTNYAISLYVEHFLNLLNVITQIYLTNWLLGTSGLNYNEITTKIFPDRAWCTLSEMSEEFDIEERKVFFSMSLGSTFRKMYFIIHIWFIVLVMLSLFHMMYCFMVVFSQRFRRWRCQHLASDNITMELDIILHQMDLGDWIVVMQIGNNISSSGFRKLIKSLYSRMEMDNIFITP